MTVVDWIITIVMVCALVWAGYYGRKLVKSVAQFTVAGREMGTWLGISTGQAEAMGLICIATGVQVGFTSGFSFVWVQLVNTLIVVVLFGILGLGIMRYRATNVQTLPQYFEMRYSRNVRIFAGISLAIGGILNMAIFPIVESQFMVAFLGLPPSVHIFGMTVGTFQITLFSILAMALFFTAIGGMVSITITEYIQAAVMFFTLSVITYIIIAHTGHGHFASGIINMGKAMETHLGDAAFNPVAKKSLGFAFVAAMLIGTFVQRLSFPPSLQKSSSAKTPKIVKQQLLLSALFGLGRVVMFNVWGIAALIIIGPMIPHGMNPEHYQRILGGVMLKNIIPPGLMGLTVGSFIFASVSTVNVYLLSWSSVIANDVVCSVIRRPFTPDNHIKLLRWVCLGVAAFIFVWGLFYKPSEHILQWFVITGTIFGGSGLIAWFGLYWKRASTAGAWCALGSSILIPTAWIVIQQTFPELIKSSDVFVKYITQDNVGLFATIFPAVLLVIVSLMSAKSNRFVDYGERLREIQAEEDAIAKIAEESELQKV